MGGGGVWPTLHFCGGFAHEPVHPHCQMLCGGGLGRRFQDTCHQPMSRSGLCTTGMVVVGCDETLKEWGVGDSFPEFAARVLPFLLCICSCISTPANTGACITSPTICICSCISTPANTTPVLPPPPSVFALVLAYMLIQKQIQNHFPENAAYLLPYVRVGNTGANTSTSEAATCGQGRL